MTWITAVLTVVAAVALLPCCVLLLQCVAAAFRVPQNAVPQSRPLLGILVPAHNEEGVLRATLDSILRQLLPGDRLLVIADNCDDSTAKVASAAPVEVLVRTDASRRGKGYALQAGLDHYRSDPPDIIVVIDADCRVEPGCLSALAATVVESGRPAQACYLMKPPADPRPIDVISSLAVLIKNRVRPLGMRRLGFPCLLTGSGSAFRWQTLSACSFAGSNIVEDMQLSIDLALAGHPPTYCDSAKVTATLPALDSAFVTQRRRWEHGHLRTIQRQLPRLLGAILRGRFDLLPMAADLAVPPLSLLCSLLLLLLTLSATWGWIAQDLLPAALSSVGISLVMAAIILGWWAFARETVSVQQLLRIPFYVARKIPLYVLFPFRSEQSWIRTARDQKSQNPAIKRVVPATEISTESAELQ